MTAICPTSGCAGRLRALAVFSLFCLASPLAAEEATLPISGDATPGMESYDRLLPAFMKKWRLPGGSVAVAKEGRLLLARGYGWADVSAKKPVGRESLFRIASVSKPITAAAVLRLVDQKKLSLEDKAFSRLQKFRLPDDNRGGAKVDARLRDITVRHLLQHTAGWDREKSFDPMFRSRIIAEATGAPPPATSAAIIRYMLRQPLDFSPGERFAYSNFGYCVLGRIIEAVTGKSYEEAVQELVLAPCGIERMRLGRTRIEERAAGEARYYDEDDRGVESVFPEVRQPVAWPDGGFYVEAMDAHGGWIASAAELARFASAIDGARAPALLSPKSLRLMTARPAPPLPQTEAAFYGLGWSIRPTADGANWWHTGSMPGTVSILVRTGDGRAWAAVFNSRPAAKDTRAMQRELDELMWTAAGQVTHWADDDLFDKARR